MPDDIARPSDVAEEFPVIDKGKDLGRNQKIQVDALIDYIATTPQNINYNIAREILKAVILDEPHPYFKYYIEKISQTEEDKESELIPGGKDLPTDQGSMNEEPGEIALPSHN